MLWDSTGLNLSEERFVVCSNTLRSGGKVILDTPCTKTVTAERASSVAGPTVWNDLPLEIETTNLDKFKTELETRLFAKC